MSCLSLPPRSLAKSYLDLDGFTRAVELLAEKVYKSRQQALAENVVQFAEEVLMPLLQVTTGASSERPSVPPVHRSEISTCLPVYSPQHTAQSLRRTRERWLA